MALFRKSYKAVSVTASLLLAAIFFLSESAKTDVTVYYDDCRRAMVFLEALQAKQIRFENNGKGGIKVLGISSEQLNDIQAVVEKADFSAVHCK
jgi:hypothetical protein